MREWLSGIRTAMAFAARRKASILFGGIYFTMTVATIVAREFTIASMFLILSVFMYWAFIPGDDER